MYIYGIIMVMASSFVFGFAYRLIFGLLYVICTRTQGSLVCFVRDLF